MKRLFRFLLTTLFVCAIATCFAACNNSQYEYGEIIYKYDANSNSYIVAGYWGKSIEAVILDEYDDGTNGLHSVTSIGRSAFRYCKYLKSITIPDSVTSIGERAFFDCYSLVNINVNENNPNYKSIDGNLYGKDGKTLIQYAIGKSATAFVIPDNVTNIGNYAFNDCSKLTSVTIPDSVTSIGNYAFENCSGLTSVTIGSGLTSIGENAFKNCLTLVEVYNKSSLNITAGSSDYGYVGYYAKNIYTEENQNKLSTDENGYIIYTDGNDRILIGYSGLETELTLPDGITEINKYTFGEKSKITKVTVPNSMKNIGDYAFNGCNSLTSITLSDSVTSIGEHAFSDCDGLTSVTIGNGVTNIGDYAFNGCSKLTNVTIPDSVTSIGNYAFSGCIGLTSITIGSCLTSIGENAFKNCLTLVEAYNKSSLNITVGSYDYGYVGYYAKNIYTEENQNKLSTDTNGYIIYADGNDRILIGYSGLETELVLPNGITEIYRYAFYGNDRITEVTLQGNVKSIGDYAFVGCIRLTSINIPHSVASVGHDAFLYCFSLTIYCEATEKPNGWDSGWNNIWDSSLDPGSSNTDYYCRVEWGITKSE